MYSNMVGVKDQHQSPILFFIFLIDNENIIENKGQEKWTTTTKRKGIKALYQCLHSKENKKRINTH